MKATGRSALIVLLFAITGWLILQVFVPRVSHETPVAHMVARMNMKFLAEQNFPSRSEVQRYLDSHELHEVGYEAQTYYVLTLSGEEEDWSLTAVPRDSEVYVHGILKKLLFLDFSKHHFPVMRIGKGSPDIVVEVYNE